MKQADVLAWKAAWRRFEAWEAAQAPCQTRDLRWLDEMYELASRRGDPAEEAFDSTARMRLYARMRRGLAALNG